MRRTVYIIGTLFLALHLTSAAPEITHTDFYQVSLVGGEEITLGVQFAESKSRMAYATASLELDHKERDFTALLDRNDDNFYSGSLGPVESGKKYKVRIKGCNTQGECVSEIFHRESGCRIGFTKFCIS